MGTRPIPGVRRVVLVGLMASGKSTVGRALAGQLGWPYRDNDELLAAVAGGSARALHQRLGADELHRLEAVSILGALGEATSTVVSAAASAIDDPGVLAALTRPGVFVVWLQGPPRLLAARLPTGPHRPSLAADVEVLLAGQLEERTPRYRAVADLVLDTTTATPEEVVAAIVAALPASSDRDPGRPAAGSPPRGAC